MRWRMPDEAQFACCVQGLRILASSLAPASPFFDPAVSAPFLRLSRDRRPDRIQRGLDGWNGEDGSHVLLPGVVMVAPCICEACVFVGYVEHLDIALPHRVILEYLMHRFSVEMVRGTSMEVFDHHLQAFDPFGFIHRKLSQGLPRSHDCVRRQSQ